MPQDLPPRAAIRRAACVLGVAACALAATGPGAAGGPIARRCLAGGTPLVAGRQALLVRGAAAGGRAELAACGRPQGRRVRVGATFGEGPNAHARSTLLTAAVGGTVVAAGFEVVAHGCIYERGCGDAPRQALRIADTAAGTLRRLPLHGTLLVVAVGADGTATFRVDEFACTSTYRTGAVPGSAVALVSRVATRVPAGAGAPLCPA